MCYGHGFSENVDVFIGFITYSEEGVNQGSGVVGGRLLNILIFHCFISIMEQMLDHNGFCELEIVACSLVLC